MKFFKGITYILLAFSVTLSAQTFSFQTLTEGTRSDLRGLSILNDSVIWAGGSRGWYAFSNNAGKSWTWKQVPGYEKLDFREVKVLDKKTAILCNAGSPAYIFKTTDGGENWKIVYTNNDSLAFIDAMDFWDGQNGIVLGDPIGGKFMILLTSDGGTTWNPAPAAQLPQAKEGEAAFAASGTCLRTFSNNFAAIVTGGKAARLFISNDKGKSWSVSETPMLHGSAAQGTFSIAVKNEKTFFLAGGDYQYDTLRTKNYGYTTDGGKTWKTVLHPPQGYRSCIELTGASSLIATGTSGTDVSTDLGKSWKKIDKGSYNTVSVSPSQKTIYAAGENGRIAVLHKVKRNKDIDEINAVLDMQVKAWNEGNIAKYMEGYWNSDSLTFESKNGKTRGWKATLERYKKAYPDKATMGKLSFNLLSEVPANDRYIVSGEWHLERGKGNVGGTFMLIWAKIDKKWRIILDHTE